MTGLRVLMAKFNGLFAKQKQDHELNEELRAHLEMLVEEKRRQGMTEEQARRAAGLHLGGIAQTEESYREARGLHVLETFLQDLRYAARMLRRSPGFTAVVICSLALGIGANTAIFSAIDAVMLRLLPVEDPQELVMLQWRANDWPEKYVSDLEGSGFGEPGQGITSYSFSYPAYRQFQKENRVFSETFAFASNDEPVNIGIDGHAETANLQGVSGNYFVGLGVETVVGRPLLPQDDQAAAPPVAVISYDFWQKHLGGSSSVAGKTMVMNGLPLTIVGVTPADFFGLEPGTLPGIFVPLAQYSADMERQYPGGDNGLTFVSDPKTWWAGVVGRLKPGITEKKAEAELRVVYDRTLTATYAAVDPNKPVLQLAPIKQGLSGLRRQFSSSLLLLMMMVGAVLLIACGNVAALLLTRASARQREIAVRLSLGARRSRIIRQLLTESVLLAFCGGALGLLVAKWAGNILVALLSSGREIIALELHLDGRVLAFTAAVCLVSGILFGLAPALRAAGVDLLSSLKQSTTGNTARFAPGKFLVAGQVALCLLLLVSASLLLRTLQALQGTNLGFNRQNLLLFTVRPGLNGYKGDQLDQFYLEMQRRMQRLPGVQSVSFADRNPIGQGSSSTTGSIPGYTEPGKGVDLYRHIVGPDYFEALAIRTRLGRVPGTQDTRTSPLVVTVNQKFVDKYMHGDNPIGRHLELGSGKRLKSYEIVGVVDDVKYARVREDVPPTAYFSHLQTVPWIFMTFMVRSGEAGQPALTAAVRREALAQDKNVPVVDMKTETQIVSQVLFLDRTFAALSSAFGFLALLLACVGLYGTMAYAVARKTNEIGIRMALGAGRSSILRMVLRETVIIVLAGIGVGLPAAWVSTGLLKARLFGLSPHDPWSIVLAVTATLVVTAIAGFIPARRASRVDPMIALRYE